MIVLIVVTAAAAVAMALPLGASAGSEGKTVTLRVWQFTSNDGIFPTLVKQFERSHPGIKVKVTYLAFGDFVTKVKLAAGGANPPDALRMPGGVPIQEQLIRARKLLNLERYSKQYGWDKRFPPDVLDTFRFDTKTGTWGTGSRDLYLGPPTAISPVGVYYNKAKLKALGLGVPRSFEEFQQALPIAKAAGDVPVVIGELDKWPAFHLYAVIQNQYTSKKILRNMRLKATTTGTFMARGNRLAAEILQDWQRKGYLTPNANSVSYDDAGKSFASGTGVFYPAGTWLNTQMNDGLGENAGFFLMPPRRGQRGYVVMSSSDEGWGVPAKGKHHAEVVEFIDFVTDERAGRLIAQRGGIPAMRIKGRLPKVSGLYKDTSAAGDIIARDDASVPYWDGTTARMIDIAGALFQELIALRITPVEFVAKVQEELNTVKG